MINIHQRSVNVERKELLSALKRNREIHAKEYMEAIQEFKIRLMKDLEAATIFVTKATPEKLKKFSFRFQYPQSHLQEYDDMIEMLELSVDPTINLDHESFKAYMKNEWAWTNQFRTSKLSYSMENSFIGGLDDISVGAAPSFGGAVDD